MSCSFFNEVNYAIMTKDKENTMLTGELKNKVDKIWESFWTGGITNSLDVIEQFTYLMFMKQLDEVETKKEADAELFGIDYVGLFPEDKPLGLV